MGGERYALRFAELRKRRERAFVPFLMLSDPEPEASLRCLLALVEAGADMLEVGIPFSDPVADGPTLQASSQRALARGATPRACLEIVARVRELHPELPIGLLVYANLVVAPGLEAFYASAAQAGLDSVLVADVPTEEALPFVEAARKAGVAPVLIAPPNASHAQLEKIAEWGAGYTYVVTRRGVTGADEQATPQARVPAGLERLGAAPAVFGFGIATPADVRRAIEAGASGVISGSAMVRCLEPWLEGRASEASALAALTELAQALKAATR